MKTAIITLDLINEICHINGKLAKYVDRIEEHKIIENINILLEWGRKQHCCIIHVRIGFRENYKDSSLISPLFKAAEQNGVLALDKWGTEFISELNRELHDICITKHRVSAFYGTELDLILRANSIERLILVGVATNNAVELTAREAHDRDFQVTIVSDSCEADSDQSQQASLAFLSRIADIVTLDKLMTSHNAR